MAEEFQAGICGGNSWWTTSSLQMVGFGLSSTPSDHFNQAWLLTNDRVDSNAFDMANTKLNYQQENSRMDDEDSSTIINGLKPLMNNQDFPISSFSSSPLLQSSLFDSSDQIPQSLFNNHFSNDLLMSPSTPTWPPPPRYSPSNCVRPSSSPLPKQLQPAGGCGGGGGVGLQFSNNINTPFWNAPATATATSTNGLFPSAQSQYSPPITFHELKQNSHSFTTKANSNEDVVDYSTSSVAKKNGRSSTTDQPAIFKRPRIETPSPLPTFKVRKEKLGDRITALQQLVSPFGKTDTASVLHEAIEYIKFLHDQVNVLNTPYMKNGAKEDMKSRGLCLVPISSTFPVANETTADFWTPTFGTTLR